MATQHLVNIKTGFTERVVVVFKAFINTPVNANERLNRHGSSNRLLSQCHNQRQKGNAANKITTTIYTK